MAREYGTLPDYSLMMEGGYAVWQGGSVSSLGRIGNDGGSVGWRICDMSVGVQVLPSAPGPTPEYASAPGHQNP